MRRVVAVTGLAIAWVCAQGSLLDTVQVFAWTRMFTQYAQTMSWSAAATQTFDPNKPCAICCAVRKARDSEPHAPIAPELRDAPRTVLVLVATDITIPPARVVWARVPQVRPFKEWVPESPKPPPRGWTA